MTVLTIITRRSGKELYLDGPDWFFTYIGHISIKTPCGSYVAYNKQEKTTRPITETLIQRDYLNKTPRNKPTNKKVPYNEIWFKKFGSEPKKYTVVASESAVEQRCDNYPAITVVPE